MTLLICSVTRVTNFYFTGEGSESSEKLTILPVSPGWYLAGLGLEPKTAFFLLCCIVTLKEATLQAAAWIWRNLSSRKSRRYRVQHRESVYATDQDLRHRPSFLWKESGKKGPLTLNKLCLGQPISLGI